ncbi:hypothetical protein PROFUN_10276 [Planoprotostelium fungivorum]|uniref:Uncharacterized protein n=1 Tax=Planoprotostelium fungivorum TaxID=1890364 RepID=A0A2P6MRP8_9EUKA|nr:hypothetical protein PROFUN_10276 [Planoprotostelium fungivorum]
MRERSLTPRFVSSRYYDDWLTASAVQIQLRRMPRLYSGRTYGKSDEQVYTVSAEHKYYPSVDVHDVEVLEWLQRREYEDMTKEWLEHLWDYGTEERTEAKERRRRAER